MSMFCYVAWLKPAASLGCRLPRPKSSWYDGVRRHLAAMGKEPPTILADRELIDRHVARVVVKPQTLDICLIPTSETSAQAENPGLTDSVPDLNPAAMIALPWTAPSFAAVNVQPRLSRTTMSLGRSVGTRTFST
jgi:hypothetical protein